MQSLPLDDRGGSEGLLSPRLSLATATPKARLKASTTSKILCFFMILFLSIQIRFNDTGYDYFRTMHLLFAVLRNKFQKAISKDRRNHKM
jgi:hypothetical protein